MPARRLFRKFSTFNENAVMLNVGKQIEYWINTAKSDFDSAEILIHESRYSHGLFFCHLSIEKGLKAHVVKTTGEIPPKSHNLIYLLELADIELL